MTRSSRPISEYLEVNRRFRRSANLEEDYGRGPQDGDYIVTPTAREVLYRLADGLGDGSPSRAWTLTGPYGVGKSAFAIFLARLLCSGDEKGISARNRLAQADPRLAVELDGLGVCKDGGKGMLPVLVTARRAPASRCVAQGIVSALKSERSRKLKAVAQSLIKAAEGTNEEPLDTRSIVEAFQRAAAAARATGYTGVLMVIDELGKLCEYAARYPRNSDLYVLQELAEHAARSGDAPALLVGLLHQSFEEYGHHLDIATRREWAKIQGRFGDIAFLESADQVVRIVGEAIRRTKRRLPKGMGTRIRRVVSAAVDAGVTPRGMSASDFREVAAAAYPLHPTALVALPFLFRRFAQNERSLFSYLSSMERYGFQEFIRIQPMSAEAPCFVRISDLFDYFTGNFGMGLYRQPHALRWLEAADVLERRDDLSDLHREVVKTVGVLNALGAFCHLKASQEMIAAAIRDTVVPDRPLGRALTDLRARSVVTHRKFNDTYRVWEGSDVDIEQRVAEGERRVRQESGLAASVRHYAVGRPLVARRHSFDTGAIRSFEVLHVDAPEELESRVKEGTPFDGKVLVCLSESPAIAEEFSERASEEDGHPDVLFAIPQQIGELRATVTELGSLRWAWENTPELRDDRVARREISLRIAEAEQVLSHSLSGLLDPRPEPIGSGCLWFYGGKQHPVETPTDVSQLLSSVCDQLYSRSPKVRNELIARRSLSSAAAAARRNLVEAMLERGDKALLRIEGYPAERSMYESVLAMTGIHRQSAEGVWGFHAPTRSRKHNLLPCWEYLSSLVFDDEPEPVPVDTLFAQLASPPCGIMDGLHPVLLCAFLLVHPDETTLYREGTFIPEPGTADFEVLMRRPELFAVAGSRVAGGRADVVDRLSEGLKVEPTAVAVVRALFQMVKSLPEFAWRTRRLAEAAIALREAFEQAKSPERFLFVELPEALGLPAFSEETPSSDEVEAFFSALNGNLQEWTGVAPKVHSQARDVLLDACGVSEGEAGWQELRQQCVRVEPTIMETQLLAFARRVVQAEADRDGIDSALALVANRPVRSWRDWDVERFPQAAAAIGRAFRQACRLAGVSGQVEGGIAALGPEEQAEAQELLRSVRQHLRKGQEHSTRVIRAAIAELMKDLQG